MMFYFGLNRTLTSTLFYTKLLPSLVSICLAIFDVLGLSYSLWQFVIYLSDSGVLALNTHPIIRFRSRVELCVYSCYSTLWVELKSVRHINNTLR